MDVHIACDGTSLPIPVLFPAAANFIYSRYPNDPISHFTSEATVSLCYCCGDFSAFISEVAMVTLLANETHELTQIDRYTENVIYKTKRRGIFSLVK